MRRRGWRWWVVIGWAAGMAAAAPAAAQVRVLTAVPRGEVGDAGATLSVNVTFDRPMIALGALSEQKADGLLTLDPPVPGKARWLGTETLVFTPDKPLAKATRYKAVVHAGLQAQDGARLVADYTWEFETVRPMLQYSNPYQGAMYVDLKQPLVLAFNQPMDAKRSQQSFELRGRPTEDLFGPIRPYVGSDYRETFPVRVRAAGDEEYKLVQWAAPDKSYLLVVEPAKALKKEYTYSLNFGEGLRAAEGNLGSRQERHVQFRTYNHFRVIAVSQQVTPGQALEIKFSNPVQGKALAEAIRFDPPLELPEYYKNHTYPSNPHGILLPLEPKARHAVTLGAGLADQFGQKLARDWNGAFSVTSYPPMLSMPTGSLTLEAKLKPWLPVTAINMKSAQAVMFRVSPQEAIARLLDANAFNPRTLWTDPARTPRPWPIDNKLDRSKTLPLELNEVLNEQGRGMLWVNLRGTAPRGDIEPYAMAQSHATAIIHKAFVQVTNLAITAKCSPENNLIWVTYLGSGLPVRGADVEVRNDAGEVLWTGKTDKDGLAMGPGWAGLDVRKPTSWSNPRVWIVASARGDAAMVASNWGTGIYPYTFGIPYSTIQQWPEFSAHVYSDRGLYRAGETAHLKAVVRRKKNGDWVLPGLKEVEVVVKNSRGEEVEKKVLPLGPFGSVAFDHALPETAVTGTYGVVVRDPRPRRTEAVRDWSIPEEERLEAYGSFRVAAFVPAKFEVSAGLERDAYTLGDKVEGSVRGWYLFGAPMKGAKYEWHARVWESGFTPPGLPGWSFGPRRYLVNYQGTSARTVLAGSGEGELGDKGTAAMRFDVDERTLLGSQMLRLEAKVVDADRQTAAHRKTALVHAGDFYLGLKPDSAFLDAGKPLSIGVLAAAPDGERVAGRDVVLKVLRREWHSVRKAGIRGRTSWVTEQKDVEAARFEVRTASPAAGVTFTPDRAGFYILHAEAEDDGGRKLYADTHFYVTGKDYVAWARGDDDKIELVADRAGYAPGDEAVIMVKSPYEKTLALVTLEREGVLSSFTAHLTGSADTVRIPVSDRHVPNVFVSVVLVQGRTATEKFSEEGEDVGKPAFKIGYVNLPVDPGTRRLGVEVTTDRAEYRPRGKVALKVRVRGPDGKGARSEFSVSVVDRGVLDLIAYATPDSFATFYGQRPLAVETVESRLHVVGQRSYGEKGENRGGGGARMAAGLLGDADLRSLFKASAFWKADAVTGADGTADLAFDLPDNLTAFKVMVTAQTQDSKFGAGDAEFRVKKPLILKPSLPRFARLGDRFDAGVVVHNQTGAAGQARLEAEIQGAALEGEAARSVQVDDGAARESLFSVRAGRLGRATLRFAGALGAERDALELSLPVLDPKPTEAVALYGNTTDEQRQFLQVPKDIYAEVGGVRLEAASTALLGLKGGLEYVLHYPHECLEQRVSRGLPFVLGADLMDAFGLSEFNGKTREETVSALLRELPKFQLAGGGFTYWAGGSIPSEYMTAYALFFLDAARDQGIAVDRAVVDKAIGFLRGAVRARDGWSWQYPYRENARLTTEAFLVYALSLWDVKEPAYIARLHAKLGQIPVFGRAMLLKAAHRNGMTRVADETAASLFNSVKQDSTRAHFEEQDPAGLDWVFYSPVRSTAYVLQAMLETGRDFPQAPKAIRWLMDERKSGRWRTTQENIYVFYALTEYMRKYEGETPDFKATVTLGGQEALSALFAGRSGKAVEKELKWDELPAGWKIPADFKKEGSGRLYYGMRLVYAPKGDLPAREEGLKVVRKVMLENGDPAPKVIAAGTRLVVKLEVTTPFDRTYIALEDPLPAGFQVVEEGFATASAEDAAKAQDARAGGERWWGSFNHRETYDDRVVIYADYLAHGTHTASYVVTAVTPGEFHQPAAKAEGMYTPEVFGRTGEGRIEIRK